MPERDLYALRATSHGLPGVRPLRLAQRRGQRRLPPPRRACAEDQAHHRVVERSSSSSWSKPSPSSLRSYPAACAVASPSPRHHLEPRPHPLRLPTGASIHHLNHHHRAGHEAARRLPQHIAAGHHRLQDAFALATHRYDAAKGMVAIPKDGRTTASTQA